MSIRKVALVVAGLDPESADRLLDPLPESMAQQVRDAVLSLGDVDPAEQREAIQLFLSGVGSAAEDAAYGDSAAAELLNSVPSPGASPEAMDRNRHSLKAGGRPIDVASERLIAECLCNELPQAIALALTQLSTQRASEVVSYLPAALQAAVLERMVALDPSSPLELANVQEEFQNWLHEQVERALHRAELAGRLATILGATNSGTRQRILHNVSNTDAGLAKELRHQLTSTSAG